MEMKSGYQEVAKQQPIYLFKPKPQDSWDLKAEQPEVLKRGLGCLLQYLEEARQAVNKRHSELCSEQPGDQD